MGNNAGIKDQQVRRNLQIAAQNGIRQANCELAVDTDLGFAIQIVAYENNPGLAGTAIEVFLETIGPNVTVEHIDVGVRPTVLDLQGVL